MNTIITKTELPEVCYAYEELECRIIGIMRGEKGYCIPSNVPDRLTIASAKAWVDHRNAAMGVTPAQREAMVAGSMFGWHLPIASPDIHKNARDYSV